MSIFFNFVDAGLCVTRYMVCFQERLQTSLLFLIWSVTQLMNSICLVTQSPGEAAMPLTCSIEQQDGDGCTNWCFVYWPPFRRWSQLCDRGASPFSLFCCHFCFLSFLPGGCSLSHLLHWTIFSIRTEVMNCHNSCTAAATLNRRIPLKESELCFGLLAVW